MFASTVVLESMKLRERMRVLAVVATGFVGLAAASVAQGAAATAAAFASGNGLTVKTVKQLDSRLYALTVKTAAVPATLNVRILLPTGYASHPHRRYPVLYLLHGTSGTASDWTVQGNAETVTAGLPLIVVMPDIAINDGGGGWCTNWPDGRQNWDTFHIHELIPWVQANLRTLDSRGERAIAGLSQGGFCSMSYAARYPQLFGEVLSFSGAPDIAWGLAGHLGAMAIINLTEVALDGVAPDTFFGNPVSDYLNWAAHDPATLAENLTNTKMYLYFGDGQPGPFDHGLGNPEAVAIETLINQDNLQFHDRLQQLGITPTVFDPYGPGTHSWPYWNRDLSWSIGPLMADFADPAPPPSSFSYQTADPSYSLYGWSVAITRKANEFSVLSTTGKSGFTLAGSGTATVTTPAFYARRTPYTVSTTTAAGTTTAVLETSAHGSLTIPVALGPSDTIQEYPLGGVPAPALGTTVDTTRVAIARGGVM
ncbi:MAG TPA: alpha/beta hydrolase family protein [Solirubrobacteraceae bacterium]|nr:alpha/beta hydrolase family protein [Solirubrobacteraceae bacterium]